MRLTQVGVKIFKDEILALERTFPDLFGAIDEWLKYQKEREAYGNTDQYWNSIARADLERELDEFRVKISQIYDLMGDKGMIEV